jgi:DNA uptake protein ComE-like DNA-binding protein
MKPNRPGEPGFILVAVLVVVMLASMVVVSLLFRLQAEDTATAAGAGAEQAWAAAMSGVYEAMRLASKAAPGSLQWQDDPASYREQLCFDDGADRWYFTIYSQGDSDQAELRFGLTDEASKLNINQATEEMFEKLPKITPYLAQGLLDFLDPDDTPRPEGAEQEYYDGLPTPYAAFNSPLTTFDELLLVRGFTPGLLYGEDANWNFQLDPNEDDGDAQFPPDNKDGKLDCGLRQYLTTYSYDLNVANDLSARVNVNDPNDGLDFTNSLSAQELVPTLTAYIEALRRNKVKIEQPADLLEAKGKFKDPAGKDIELESGVSKAELPLLLDHFTARTNRQTAGLININTASSHVLQALPGVDEALADSIVAARRNLRAEQLRTPAWLYQEGLVDADQFKKLMPYLTARAYQFHIQVVAYGLPSGRYRVLESVIDIAGSQPTIVYLRDITRLGLPFRIDATGEGDRPGNTSPSDQQQARSNSDRIPARRRASGVKLPRHGSGSGTGLRLSRFTLPSHG